MQRRRAEEDGREERAAPAPTAPPPAPAAGILELQRTAGNAAVARMLQREPAPTETAAPGQAKGEDNWSFSPTAKKPFNPFEPQPGLMDDYNTATQAVMDWFDKAADGLNKQGGAGFLQSVPELVDMARGLTVTTKLGKAESVKEVVPQAADIERILRGRARFRGIGLLEHRSLSDLKGVESETMAMLANLGAKIPDHVTFGGDDAKITLNIGGTVTGHLKAGGVEIDAEGSKDGANATAKFKGGQAGIQVSDKGVKAELKAGDLLAIHGSVLKKDDSTWEWKADLQFGTLGKLITPAEIAKVMQGAQDTFSKSAADLANGVSVEKVKANGSALKEAADGVIEVAKKSAEQAKSGWQVGVSVQGGPSGGVSGTVTFTWVF
jgi:hypothetical protein